MKYRNPFRLLFTLPPLLLVVLTGCKTPPEPQVIYRDREVQVPVEVRVPVEIKVPVEVPVFVQAPPESIMPLTAGILSRLRESEDFFVDQCQFFLSGKIILERDDEEERQGLVDGRVVFEADHTRRLVTLEDQTAGQALGIVDNSRGTELYLCFEDDNRYVLIFESTRGDSSLFSLKFIAQNDPLSGTRGSLEYGGQPYRLRYTGNIPSLMLKLETKNTPVTYRHTVPGRRVNAAETAGLGPPIPLTIDILDRLKRSENFKIDQCQFYLSGRIVLERIDEERRVYVVDGTAVFENSNATRHITFEDQVGGLALEMVENRRSIDLYLSFDTEDNYRIKFSSIGKTPDARFSLQYTEDNDPLSDARGFLEYGGLAYRLRFSSGTPHLMLRLSQTEEVRTQQRTAPGRRVNP